MESCRGISGDLGFRQEAVENGKPHDYYIPENIFYRLCMKAKNDVAEKFQTKVAHERLWSASVPQVGVRHSGQSI